ncbi:MAG: S9 family peptidase [Candidatus Thiodiazotropha sp. (ex Monitilora ramsayi)]|nr:S9 family peptidase [Candidatus Thiodiazotropha sp. (ex Monitilora ramsayi)]
MNKPKFILKPAVIFALLALSGCSSLQPIAHVYSKQAPEPNYFRYQDDEISIFYTFLVGDSAQPDTFIFFYGGSGCPSWKYVMPDYVNGLSISARIFVLNKRFVSDRSTGMFGCKQGFHIANNPDQWVVDYSEFITAQLKSIYHKPKNVGLVGVSEGSLPAVRIAGLIPEITHLAIIGDGGYPMRQVLTTLEKKNGIVIDIDSAWKNITADPRSIEKSWLGHPYRYWSNVMDIDPLPDFLKLDIPIMVGIGEKDRNVPVESAYFLESEFKEAGKKNLLLVVYPGADHRLQSKGNHYRSDFFTKLGQLLQESHNK